MLTSGHISKFFMIAGIGLAMTGCASASSDEGDQVDNAITGDEATRAISNKAEIIAKFDVPNEKLGIKSWSIASVPAGTVFNGRPTESVGFMAFAIDTTNNVKYGVFYEENVSAISYFAYEVNGNKTTLDDAGVRALNDALSTLRHKASDACHDAKVKVGLGLGAAVVLGGLAAAVGTGAIVISAGIDVFSAIVVDLSIGAVSGVASIGLVGKAVVDAIDAAQHDCKAASGIR